MIPRPTEAEFNELKRQRNEAIKKIVCEELILLGGDLDNDKDWPSSHDHATICYCDCPDGPCQHEWGSWRNFKDGNGGEQVCKRCGMGAMGHSLRTAP